jgi:hypothetical protein
MANRRNSAGELVARGTNVARDVALGVKSRIAFKRQIALGVEHAMAQLVSTSDRQTQFGALKLRTVKRRPPSWEPRQLKARIQSMA